MKSSTEKDNQTEVKRVYASLISEDAVQLPFKIIIMGQPRKTSILSRFVNKIFQQNYYSTVGVDFLSKVVKIIDEDERSIYAHLKIWDTCGQDIYSNMISMFYKGASGVLLAFSLSDRKSFEKARDWYQRFSQNGNINAVIFLIGNKADLQRQVKAQEAQDLLKQIQGVSYIQTSAKTGDNIEYIFTKISQVMVMKYRTSRQFRNIIKIKSMISGLSKSQSAINEGYQLQLDKDSQSSKSTDKKKCVIQNESPQSLILCNQTGKENKKSKRWCC